jgi:hypothetical protein
MLRDAGKSVLNIVNDPPEPRQSIRLACAGVIDRAAASHRAARVLAATVVSFWLTTLQTTAQSRETAFGVPLTHSTPESFERLRIFADATSEPSLLLWNTGATSITMASFTGAGQLVSYRQLFTTGPFDDVLVADVNGDGKPDLLLTSRDARTISVVTNLQADTLRPVSTITLPLQPTRVIAGDVTNNKRLDLLVVDRNSPGVLPLLGNGRGQFTPAPLVAPDNVVGDLALVHLNNDLLLDIVLYDWVKSEFHMLYGIGRGRFVDLTTIPVDGEVRQIIPTWLTGERFLDLVVTFNQPPQVQVWETEGRGELKLRSTHPLQHIPLVLEPANLTDDGWMDFVMLDQAGTVRVALNEPSPTHAVWLEYATAGKPRSMAVMDVNHDGRPDALVLDQTGRRLTVYFNAQQETVLADSLDLATGWRPRGIWVGGLLQDESSDLVVVNGGSSALSVFSSLGPGRFAGQSMIPLDRDPRTLEFHSATDTTLNFFVSYPSSRSISYLTLLRKDLSTVNTIIPDVGEMEFLHGSLGADGFAEFFCYNASPVARVPSLALYQQIEASVFLERSFRLAIPDALLGAAVGDLNNDGIIDVAYAYRNAVSRQNELAVSLGDSALSFTQRVVSLQLPAGPIRKTYLWLADFDNDGVLDMLISFPQTLKLMRVAKGFGDGNFLTPVTIEDGIAINDRSQVQIGDFDGDGVLDIAVNNAERRAVGWLRGKGDCTFAEWTQLAAPSQVGHFTFRDVNRDGVPDLVVTLTDEGRVRLYDGRRFFGMGMKADVE